MGIKRVYRRKPSTGRHYVNNAQLYAALIEYRKVVEDAKPLTPTASHNYPQKPQVPRYVGECILLICTRLGFRPNFSRYTYREDMVGDAIENCVSAVDNFDPNKTSNPFGYFTQIAFNAFIRKIQREKKQSYIKYKNYENSFFDAEMRDHENGDDNRTTQKGTNVNVDEFIANFERTMSKPRRRGEKKKVARILG